MGTTALHTKLGCDQKPFTGKPCLQYTTYIQMYKQRQWRAGPEQQIIGLGARSLSSNSKANESSEITDP